MNSMLQQFLKPSYTRDDVTDLKNKAIYAKSLDGTDYIPGCIGLNNIGNTDFFNVVIHAICSVIPLRNKLLLLDIDKVQPPDAVLTTLVGLIRKIYNKKNFKGIVSPHEFLQVSYCKLLCVMIQAVGVASNGTYKIGTQSDPVALLTWLMNRIHIRLRNKKSWGKYRILETNPVFVRVYNINYL